MRKVVFTLNIGNYAPEIRAMTYPLMKFFAQRIGAEFREITERKYPDWPVVYEKMQIYELGKGYDWIYFFDADCLIHPECVDFTWHLDDDVCMHNGQDMAHIRFRYDEHFSQDRRNIGTCGWMTIAPKKCIGIWKPTDKTVEQTIDCCYPTSAEVQSGLIDKGHLVDDYVMSHNIAQFGVKHTTAKDLLPAIGLPDADFFFHLYMISEAEKLQKMKEVLRRWNVQIEGVDLGYFHIKSG